MEDLLCARTWYGDSSRSAEAMKLLSRSDELLLLACWRLQPTAYAVTIREHLKEVTGKTWAFGAIFVSLDRLVKRGFIVSRLSDPTPERGGKSKRLYRLTSKGAEALIEIKRLEEVMWADISELSLSAAQ